MALYSYKIAVGHDNIGGLVNIETIFRTPPRGVRLPLGAVTRYAISGRQRTDGERIVIWQWSVARHADLDTFISTFFSTGWNLEITEVTIGTRYRDNGFSGEGTRDYWNALAYLPIEGRDYQHRDS